MAALSDERLEAIVTAQIRLAKDHDRHEREGDRSKAIAYYTGTPESMAKWLPIEVGRSKVVSKDLSDTVGWMLPGIMRVFTASDRMALAEPTEEGDVPFAKQATDGMNYVFWKDNKGYEIVYSATWDGLLFGNGVVKTYFDDEPVYKTSVHSNLTEDEATKLLMGSDDGEEPEVLAKSERMVTMPDEMGNLVPTVVYDLKIKSKHADGRFVIEAIPPEKFLIDDDATCTDEAAFTAHWDRKMRSELIAMGYDKDTVMAIPVSGRNETPEEIERRHSIMTHDASDKSTELVDYYECFIRIDVDGDGEAELVRACVGGAENGKMLDWEVWEDENPFDDIPCEPVPHRWTARSIADETMDVMDIKTTLLRQGLNNVYASVNPQRFVTGKIENMDELLSPTFGGVVIGGPGATVTDLTVPFVADTSFQAIAYQDEVVQRRTGVSRQGMALDPETLQNQSATAAQQQQDASYSQIEQIARNMAEWGWKKVFRKLLRLMIKHQGPRRLMLNGKSIDINPRFWNADMDVTINVGLGTGSRDRDLMMLGNILQTQTGLAERFMGMGAADDALDMLPKILRTMVKMAESAGIRNPEDFYPEYTQEKVDALKQMAEQRAAQPDPKVQIEQQKLEADQAKGQMQMQMDQQKAASQMQIEQMKAQQSAELQREGMMLDAELKREQLIAEMNLKREQLNAELMLKRELSMEEMAMKREVGFYNADTKVATSQVSMGGEPG